MEKKLRFTLTPHSKVLLGLLLFAALAVLGVWLKHELREWKKEEVLEMIFMATLIPFVVLYAFKLLFGGAAELWSSEGGLNKK